MLQNAYFLAKIGADTAENEQHFAEILPTDALWRRPDPPEVRLRVQQMQGGGTGDLPKLFQEAVKDGIAERKVTPPGTPISDRVPPRPWKNW